MSCPRCGYTDAGTVECPRCGVVFAKVDRARFAVESEEAFRASPEGGSLRSRLEWIGLLVAVATLLLWWHGVPGDSPTRLEPPRSSDTPKSRYTSRFDSDVGVGSPPAAGTATPWMPVVAIGPQSSTETLEAPQMELVETLESRITRHRMISEWDISWAERLHRGYPRSVRLRNLLVNLLVYSADQMQQYDRGSEAISLLERATQEAPDVDATWSALARAHLARRDWPHAESVARDGLERHGHAGNADLSRSLARALMRLDRYDEALEVLRSTPSLQADRQAREMSAELEREAATEKSISHGASEHFRLRFAGPPDFAFGEAVLQALEARYGQLASTFGDRPAGSVAVVLYSEQEFRARENVEWSRGSFHAYDGRIQVGLRGQSPRLSSELEQVLAHELTHAFVDALAGRYVPADINEGLAQHLSGRRLRVHPPRARAMAVATAGEVDVHAFYEGAQDFVEFLLQRNGQGVMNELLVTMGRTGQRDVAFRTAYGKSHEELRQEWLAQLPSS
jgi:tetratricopeptide (TPR) repeat protein